MPINVTVVHKSLTGAPADPRALIDGVKWDEEHTVTIGGSLILDDLGLKASVIRNDSPVAGNTMSDALAALLSAVSAVPVDASRQTHVYAYDYGVRGDGGTYTTQGQAAINAARAANKPIIWPAGIIKTAGWTDAPSAASNVGLQWRGAGPLSTTFQYVGTVGGYLLSATTAADSEFQNFVTIEGCGITGAGLYMAKCNNVKLRNVFIGNASGDGIHIAGGGDATSSSIIDIKGCLIGPLSGWAISGLPDDGHTELSLLRVEDTLIYSCGTQSTAVPPTSGGIAWRGIDCLIESMGFTETKNTCIYIAQGGTALNLSVKDVDFENTMSSVLPSVYCDTGLRLCRMEGVEFLQGAAPLTNQGAVWFTSQVGNVVIDGVKVRVAPDNNPWTAFKATGTQMADTIRVRNVWWQAFDTTGQQRYSGILFDPVIGQCQFLISALDTATVKGVGYGQQMPMYLGGINGSGEWVSYQVPSAGISSALPAPLTPSTTYYFFLYNSADVNTPITGHISWSTTPPVQSFPGGYLTMNGDPSALYIGKWTTDATGHFQTAANFGVGSSWYPAGNALDLLQYSLIYSSGNGELAGITDVPGDGGLPLVSQGGFGGGGPARWSQISRAAISGWGANVSAALGVAVGTAGSIVVNGGNLGTPSAGVATNLTGTAAGLTAGHVTTNANLTGDVTSVGNATTLATVNGNVGSFGSATQSVQLTVNGKGLITAAANVTITPAIGNVTGLGAGVATVLGNATGTNNAVMKNNAGAVLETTLADPTGTTSSTGVMAGFGSVATLTPVQSSRVNVTFRGSCYNVTGGGSVRMQLRYGTGAAPANGAAPAGTAIGSRPYTLQSSPNNFVFFNRGAVITGLTPGTAYWFDLVFDNIGNGTTANLSNCDVTAFEF